MTLGIVLSDSGLQSKVQGCSMFYRDSHFPVFHLKVGGAKQPRPLNPELKGWYHHYNLTDGNEAQSAPEGSLKTVQGIPCGLSRQTQGDKTRSPGRVQKKLQHKENRHDYGRLLTQEREKATDNLAAVGQNHSHVEK